MDDDSGLFNIDVDSSASEPEPEKVPRDFQSEEDFQAVKAQWRPKVETGEVLPLALVAGNIFTLSVGV